MVDLVVAVPQFPVSETFVRDHIRTISPDSTAVISIEDPGDTLSKDIPLLCERRGMRGLIARVHSHLRFLSPTIEALDRWRIERFLQRHDIKACLAEYLTFGFRMIDPARNAGKPLYVYAHGWDVALGFRDPAWRARYSSLFSAASGIVVASNYMAQRLTELGCLPDKLHKIPCGIDCSQFSRSAREPGRILAVGRLVEKKAPHLTLKAFAQVSETHPEAHLHMVGEGPLRGECERLIHRHNLQASVTMHGAQPPEFVRAHLEKAAIFVQHSVTARNGDTEGLGVSLLEAMASAVPVVATIHNGFPETVRDGVTGILVPEQDVSRMADAICSLLRDSTRLGQMGDAGPDWVNAQFSLDKSAQALRNLMSLGG